MKKYDAIIIGGGLGGLTTAAMLSKEGLSVCVLEQHFVIGGCLQSFQRNGRTLDTGMHYVGSMSEGQILHQYFKYLGIVDSLKMQRLDENGFDQFHFNDGSCYSHAMGIDNFIDRLSSSFPEERKGIKSLCQTLQDVGELISPSILREGRISGGGLEYMSVSAYEEINKYVKNDKLREVFAGNTGLYAGNKQTTSFYQYGMITYSNILGAYAFVGGTQQIADLLVNEIRTNGGDVLLKAKVSAIHLQDNDVESVELASGERFSAKWVISSLHPAVTFSLLKNNTVYKKAFFTRINSLQNTYGLFTTYLLLKPNTMKYVNQNHYFFGNNTAWDIDGIYNGKFDKLPTLLCMQSNLDNEYCNVVTLLTPMSFSQCEKWVNTNIEHRGEDYKEFKAKFSEAVIDFVCGYMPELRACIDKVYTASPLTYRDYTAIPDGSAYGIIKDYRNPMITLMPARTRISNLLLTGQNLNVHGCLGTIVSAAVTCSEIVGTEYLAKKIGNA